MLGTARATPGHSTSQSRAASLSGSSARRGLAHPGGPSAIDVCKGTSFSRSLLRLEAGRRNGFTAAGATSAQQPATGASRQGELDDQKLLEDMILSLRDIDESSQIRRLASLRQVYGTVLRATDSQLGPLTDYRTPPPVLDVCEEALLYGDTVDQAAACGLLGALIDTIQHDHAALYYLNLCDGLGGPAELVRLVTPLLDSPDPQVRWACTTLLQAVCCFPKLLSALLANDAAHVALLRAGVRPLLAASQPQPKFWEGKLGARVGPPSAAAPPPQPAVPFGAAYPTEVAFPSDWRSAEELNSDVLESMYTVLVALYTGGNASKRAQLDTNLHAALVGLLWEEQAAQLRASPSLHRQLHRHYAPDRVSEPSGALAGGGGPVAAVFAAGQRLLAWLMCRMYQRTSFNLFVSEIRNIRLTCLSPTALDLNSLTTQKPEDAPVTDNSPSAQTAAAAAAAPPLAGPIPVAGIDDPFTTPAAPDDDAGSGFDHALLLRLDKKDVAYAAELSFGKGTEVAFAEAADGSMSMSLHVSDFGPDSERQLIGFRKLLRAASDQVALEQGLKDEEGYKPLSMAAYLDQVKADMDRSAAGTGSPTIGGVADGDAASPSALNLPSMPGVVVASTGGGLVGSNYGLPDSGPELLGYRAAGEAYTEAEYKLAMAGAVEAAFAGDGLAEPLDASVTRDMLMNFWMDCRADRHKDLIGWPIWMLHKVVDKAASKQRHLVWLLQKLEKAPQNTIGLKGRKALLRGAQLPVNVAMSTAWGAATAQALYDINPFRALTVQRLADRDERGVRSWQVVADRARAFMPGPPDTPEATSTLTADKPPAAAKVSGGFVTAKSPDAAAASDTPAGSSGSHDSAAGVPAQEGPKGWWAATGAALQNDPFDRDWVAATQLRQLPPSAVAAALRSAVSLPPLLCEAPAQLLQLLAWDCANERNGQPVGSMDPVVNLQTVALLLHHFHRVHDSAPASYSLHLPYGPLAEDAGQAEAEQAIYASRLGHLTDLFEVNHKSQAFSESSGYVAIGVLVATLAEDLPFTPRTEAEIRLGTQGRAPLGDHVLAEACSPWEAPRVQDAVADNDAAAVLQEWVLQSRASTLAPGIPKKAPNLPSTAPTLTPTPPAPPSSPAGEFDSSSNQDLPAELQAALAAAALASAPPSKAGAPDLASSSRQDSSTGPQRESLRTDLRSSATAATAVASGNQAGVDGPAGTSSVDGDSAGASAGESAQKAAWSAPVSDAAPAAPIVVGSAHVQNLSASLNAVYAVLAAFVLSNPRDALPLCKQVPYVLEVAAKDIRGATEGPWALRTTKYMGTPYPAWHHPLILAHSLAQRAQTVGSLAAELATETGLVDSLLRFSEHTLSYIEYHLDSDADDLYNEMHRRAVYSGELSYLALGDAVAYAGVALLSLSLLGSASPDVRKRLGRAGVNQHVRAVMLVSRLEKRLQKQDTSDGLPGAMFYSHTDRLGRFVLRHFMAAPVNPCATPAVATTEVSRLARAHGRDFDCQPGLNSTLQKISDGSILRVSLSALELAIQDGDKDQLEAILGAQGLMVRLRSQLLRNDSRSYRAISLLTAMVTADAGAASSIAAQAVPAAVMRVFLNLVNNFRAALPADAAPDALSMMEQGMEPGAAGGGTRPRSAELESLGNLAAVCVQFFLRMAAVQSDSTDASAANRLVVGGSSASVHVPSLARLPRLVESCLPLLQHDTGAAQQLAAELLRLLSSDRGARVTLRNSGAVDLLLDALNSGPPQVQTSALATMRTLWTAEKGDDEFQRELYLARETGRDSRVEVVTDLMRAGGGTGETTEWFAATDTAISEPAKPPSPAASIREHLKEKQRSGWTTAQDSPASTSPWQAAVREASVGPDPQGSEPGSKLQSAVGSGPEAGDASAAGEGELLGVVCVTADHQIKLCMLEHLPEQALVQLELAAESERPDVRGIMLAAIEFARFTLDDSDDDTDTEASGERYSETTVYDADLAADSATSDSASVASQLDARAQAASIADAVVEPYEEGYGRVGAGGVAGSTGVTISELTRQGSPDTSEAQKVAMGVRQVANAEDSTGDMSDAAADAAEPGTPAVSLEDVLDEVEFQRYSSGDVIVGRVVYAATVDLVIRCVGLAHVTPREWHAHCAAVRYADTDTRTADQAAGGLSPALSLALLRALRASVLHATPPAAAATVEAATGPDAPEATSSEAVAGSAGPSAAGSPARTPAGTPAAGASTSTPARDFQFDALSMPLTDEEAKLAALLGGGSGKGRASRPDREASGAPSNAEAGGEASSAQAGSSEAGSSADPRQPASARTTGQDAASAGGPEQREAAARGTSSASGVGADSSAGVAAPSVGSAAAPARGNAAGGSSGGALSGREAELLAAQRQVVKDLTKVLQESIAAQDRDGPPGQQQRAFANLLATALVAVTQPHTVGFPVPATPTALDTATPSASGSARPVLGSTTPPAAAATAHSGATDSAQTPETGTADWSAGPGRDPVADVRFRGDSLQALLALSRHAGQLATHSSDPALRDAAAAVTGTCLDLNGVAVEFEAQDKRLALMLQQILELQLMLTGNASRGIAPSLLTNRGSTGTGRAVTDADLSPEERAACAAAAAKLVALKAAMRAEVDSAYCRVHGLAMDLKAFQDKCLASNGAPGLASAATPDAPADAAWEAAVQRSGIDAASSSFGAPAPEAPAAATASQEPSLQAAGPASESTSTPARPATERTAIEPAPTERAPAERDPSISRTDWKTQARDPAAVVSTAPGEPTHADQQWEFVQTYAQDLAEDEMGSDTSRDAAWHYSLACALADQLEHATRHFAPGADPHLAHHESSATGGSVSARACLAYQNTGLFALLALSRHIAARAAQSDNPDLATNVAASGMRQLVERYEAIADAVQEQQASSGRVAEATRKLQEDRELPGEGKELQARAEASDGIEVQELQATWWQEAEGVFTLISALQRDLQAFRRRYLPDKGEDSEGDEDVSPAASSATASSTPADSAAPLASTAAAADVTGPLLEPSKPDATPLQALVQPGSPAAGSTSAAGSAAESFALELHLMYMRFIGVLFLLSETDAEAEASVGALRESALTQPTASGSDSVAQRSAASKEMAGSVSRVAAASAGAAGGSTPSRGGSPSRGDTGQPRSGMLNAQSSADLDRLLARRQSRSGSDGSSDESASESASADRRARRDTANSAPASTPGSAQSSTATKSASDDAQTVASDAGGSESGGEAVGQGLGAGNLPPRGAGQGVATAAAGVAGMAGAGGSAAGGLGLGPGVSGATAQEAAQVAPKMAGILASGSEPVRKHACITLMSLLRSDPAWPAAALDAKIHLYALDLVRSGTVGERTAAIVLLRTFLLSSRSGGVAIRAAGYMKSLASVLQLTGPRAAEARYEAASSLAQGIESMEDVDTVSLRLGRICTLIEKSDLEAEVTVLLRLAYSVCNPSSTYQAVLASTGVLARVLQLMRHPNSTVRFEAVSLMTLAASNTDTRRAFLALPRIYTDLSDLMAEGASPNAALPPAVNNLAATAALCARQLVAHQCTPASGRAVGDDVMKRMCEAGVMVRAVQLLTHGPARAKYEAACLVRDALTSGVDEAHYHTLSLGVVPQLWRELKRVQDLVQGYNVSQGPSDAAGISVAEHTMDAVEEALEAVESTTAATIYIASAGMVPLRWHLFVANTGTLLGSDSDGDGGSGGGSIQRYDGGGGGGGGTPAIL